MLGKRKERATDSPTPNLNNERDVTAPQSGYAVARQLVLEELDLEIRVRQRLKETIESRIGWATCLQTSLNAVREDQGSDSTGTLPAVTIFHPSRTPTSYIRDSSTNTIARLACPDCARGDFPRVQSLLNHCRIQHGREFGSHDECIRGCAVQVPADEEAWVIENGSELRNVSLPSLRRLFEMAVGDVGSPLEISPVNDAPSVHQDLSPEHITVSGRETLRSSAPTHASTHLSRTLGHHVDTPALAPFLGRAPKRRSITTYDENVLVDIDGSPHAAPGRRWRIPLTHRSRARPALDLIIPVDAPLPQLTPHVAPVTQGTRFHIVSRVTISDRSLWIPIDRRSTHRWCLSIEAPTYVCTLITATITCLSPNPPPTRALDEPLKVSGPPFFACGTTSQPFLARLRFQWTSGSSTWFTRNTPVLGDEQVLDVELDRNTVFRQIPPSKHGLDPWNLDSESLPASPKPVPALPVSLARYITLLRSLVPVFPLTLRDLKGRSSTPLPYKLVSSPAQFRAFVPGRRKAIEWTRARALREASIPNLLLGSCATICGQPPAPTEKRTSERIMPSAADTFCPACSPSSGPSVLFSSTSRLPLLDVGATETFPLVSTRCLSRNRSDSQFCRAEHLISLNLSCFQSHKVKLPFPVEGVYAQWHCYYPEDGRSGHTRPASAILALSVREFARCLVQSAGEPASGDRQAHAPPVALALSTLAQLPRKDLL
ncbi:hypothetical protein EDB86DRAFT_2996886 [Lactarius hatsudake]|nr:hypothetical protein EDB86DRAFT_2996886 [Lactarius hatsudake]